MDALAIAIGTSHGAYKFTRKPTGDILAIDRIKAIHARIPNTHLVMHGSSSVPQDLLAIIRDNGGEMKETYGVPVEEIQEGIKHGVRKVNIDTDIRLAMTAAIRKYLNENRSAFDPRDFLKPARAAAKAICKQRYEQFGCAGQASKLTPIPLESDGEPLREGRAEGRRRLTAMDLYESSLKSLPLVARGKVRDIYAVGDDKLLLVASDRLSAYDVIMPTPIPEKGRVLTEVANFWFAKLAAHRAQPPHRHRPGERGRARRSASRCAAAPSW